MLDPKDGAGKAIAPAACNRQSDDELWMTWP